MWLVYLSRLVVEDRATFACPRLFSCLGVNGCVLIRFFPGCVWFLFTSVLCVINYLEASLSVYVGLGLGRYCFVVMCVGS